MDKSVWQWMIEPFRVYRTVIFPGRARRKEFWWFSLLQLLIYVPFIFLLIRTMPVPGDPVPTAPPLGFWLIYLLVMALGLPQLWVSVRRLHDTNRRGWWLLLPTGAILVMTIGAMLLVTLTDVTAVTAGNPSTVAVIFGIASAIAVVASYILLLVWLCQRGTIGENRFGPDPISE